MENNWVQKPCEDNLEMHGIDNEMNIGQAYTTDEAIPILDLRYSGPPMEGDSLHFDSGLNPRRMSGSSFTMSTSGALSDMPSYEDFSAALSDAPSFSSEYPPPSNRNSLMSSTQLSPVASPRMTPQTAQQPHFLMSHPPAFHRNSMLLPSQLPSQAFHPEAHQFDAPPPLLSHGLFRMLQSNADPHSLHSHYTDLSDPPDLYASLHEEQVPPPPEDMNPSDPDLVPHEQELRFDGDLYTPRWVRGHGNKREGWCGICKPGRWLVLKNSAFWYDKSFTHGISAATGSPFQEPQETRRMDGNPDVWEGLCGSCNEWIALVSSKKKGTTWFRHAYKVSCRDGSVAIRNEEC
ncbi:hypothetical protein UCRPA7_350 [Phaeoacremonium minimum UCRPA7]|uniref:Transcription regulator Rua1 C-terminal domain-containing protein n=1 Tax=Phaeoacremonium minimum (strain UCR-PA7) TaxID=1286976 RepID=R8BXN7_PHAM7|nr:hypothetical protein UCRPA7_350 [Phaeoacremonium minimum UCRPA7]EOO04118.1 hypothetical protein UCRPA7_350 [Phaeoacremonium minimum UCRPA7]